MSNNTAPGEVWRDLYPGTRRYQIVKCIPASAFDPASFVHTVDAHGQQRKWVEITFIRRHVRVYDGDDAADRWGHLYGFEVPP